MVEMGVAMQAETLRAGYIAEPRHKASQTYRLLYGALDPDPTQRSRDIQFGAWPQKAKLVCRLFLIVRIEHRFQTLN